MWPQILADVLDKPVHRLDDPGFANSLGTAISAFDRLGVASAADLADRVAVRSVHEPDRGERQRYDDLAGVFADAFGRTKPLSHRLTLRR